MIRLILRHPIKFLGKLYSKFSPKIISFFKKKPVRGILSAVIVIGLFAIVSPEHQSYNSAPVNKPIPQEKIDPYAQFRDFINEHTKDYIVLDKFLGKRENRYWIYSKDAVTKEQRAATVADAAIRYGNYFHKPIAISLEAFPEVDYAGRGNFLATAYINGYFDHKFQVDSTDMQLTKVQSDILRTLAYLDVNNKQFSYLLEDERFSQVERTLKLAPGYIKKNFPHILLDKVLEI